jgi:integrase
VLGVHCVCKLVTLIGKKAGVVVNAAEGKTASAQDLRRTFGSRWAKQVMPAVLHKLMRHGSVQTTMQSYVDVDVDEMADELWKSTRRRRQFLGRLVTFSVTSNRFRPKTK